MTNETGDVTDTYTYEAFGGPLHSTGATLNDYLFTGEQYDVNAGFYYLRARYYHVNIGRFVTTDTWKGNIYEPPSLHKYLYVRNNPINRIDPSGNFSLLETVAISSLIGSLSGMGVYVATHSEDEFSSKGFIAYTVAGGSIGALFGYASWYTSWYVLGTTTVGTFGPVSNAALRGWSGQGALIHEYTKHSSKIAKITGRSINMNEFAALGNAIRDAGLRGYTNIFGQEVVISYLGKTSGGKGRWAYLIIDGGKIHNFYVAKWQELIKYIPNMR